MKKNIIDNLWLWSHPKASYNDNDKFGLTGRISTYSPVEAANELGINNIIMVAFNSNPKPPFHDYAKPLTGMDNVVWSILGDSSSKDSATNKEINNVTDLKSSLPNLSGGIMDDFFDFKGGRKPVEKVKEYVDKLHALGLKLWVVVYDRQMDDPILEKFLGLCDVISFWTWKAEFLPNTERHLDKLSKMVPDKDIALGCYMWDFGNGKPLSISDMEFQCNLAVKKYKQGQISDIIMLGSPLCGMGIEAVSWTKDWIKTLK